MDEPFTAQINQMADTMGVALYQRFSVNEASLFLRCPMSEMEKLVRRHEIAYICLAGNQIEFFGHQLLEYLVGQIVPTTKSTPPASDSNAERIVNTKEVQELTGLSRTTIWRLENSGKFPRRIALSTARVGWRYQDVLEWMRDK